AAQSSPVRGLVRRRTATSCRSTSSSAFFDADERPSSTSQPQRRMKTRYSRRRDNTADHHGLSLTLVHRRSPQARQTSGTPQGVGFLDPGELGCLAAGEVPGVFPQRVAGVLEVPGVTGGDADRPAAMPDRRDGPGVAGGAPDLAAGLVEGAGGPGDDVE